MPQPFNADIVEVIFRKI